MVRHGKIVVTAVLREEPDVNMIVQALLLIAKQPDLDLGELSVANTSGDDASADPSTYEIGDHAQELPGGPST